MAYSTGDRVGMLINMDDKSLVFYKNGNKQSKDPFMNLPESVRVAVCFGGSN